VVVVSDIGRVVYINPAAESLFGRSGRAILGQPAETLFERTKWLAELLERSRAEPAVTIRDQGPVAHDDGPQDVLAVVGGLRARDGRVCGTIITLHDFGHRQRLVDDELTRRRRDELDRLVASIGHEINNPLSGIRGAAQLLGKKLRAWPELDAYAAMIVRQADRMAELVRLLMRLEGPVPTMKRINIHRVLQDVLLLERAGAQTRSIAIETVFDPSLPEVLGDSDQLQQLFLNLLKNALAVCKPTSGRVMVTTRMENRYYVETDSERLRYIAVEITDNGPGLDDETAQRMFSPFFSRTAGGHGMGLAVARSITTAHRGHISAFNAPEGGACFRVTLPVAEGRRSEPAS
jgi:two-component system nitrogen regulation sensor histidine kinase GlnL